AALDDLVERVEDSLERRMRPEARGEVLDAETNLVATFLDRRGDGGRAVVGGGFLAPTEEIEVLFLGLLAELDGLGPSGRWGPAIVLEQLRRVPDGIDGHHVVESDEPAIVGTRSLDTANQRVADLDAVETDGIEYAVHVLELIGNGGKADEVAAGVVDQVRRIAADEARLQLGGDLRRRRDIDGYAGVVLAHQLGSKLDIVDAVASVED